MGFEPMTLRDLVGCSNHWATRDSVVSKGQIVGIDWNRNLLNIIIIAVIVIVIIITTTWSFFGNFNFAITAGIFTRNCLITI